MRARRTRNPLAQHTWRIATRKCEEKLYKKRFYKAQEKSHALPKKSSMIVLFFKTNKKPDAQHTKRM